jgi:hypothetical protein
MSDRPLCRAIGIDDRHEIGHICDLFDGHTGKHYCVQCQEDFGGSPDAWPGCGSGCGAPADLQDNRGRWWCNECFFDPTAIVGGSPDE